MEIYLLSAIPIYLPVGYAYQKKKEREICQQKS